MARLASLWLPDLAIDRIGRTERSASPLEPRRKAAAPLAPIPDPPRNGRVADCSCPRNGGWCPGARWAQAPMAGQEEAVPAHRLPSRRELGRRSEPAAVVFRHRDPVMPAAKTAHALPRVTAHRDGNQMVVAALCPAARMLGLTPGMPLSKARIVLPGLDVRDADPEGDAAWLQRLALFAARRWTPRAAVSGADGLWLDLSGVAHLFGGEAHMCARILAFCRRLGFTARIAVADTAGAAHALARHGGASLVLCPPGGQAEALADFPLAALRVDLTVLDAARRLGIETIGALAAMPRAPLQRRFGSTLLIRLDQALGRASEPLDPIVPAEPPSVLLRFMEPIATSEAITEALGEGMRRLVPKLEEAGLGVRRLAMRWARVDGADQEAAIGTARATRDGAHLLKLMRERVDRLEPGFGLESLRLVALRVEPLASETISGPLGGKVGQGDLAALVDCLAVRLGPRRIYRMGALESDLPERSVARVDPLSTPASWPKWPRPVRLLVPPEPVEQVMSALPDGPPRRFRWRGRDYQVAAADGPERVYGEWWRRTAERETVRDYFQVEAEGARFWLFREGDGESPATGDHRWRLHGIFA